ncbi:MAG: hypothetical protein ACREC0_12445, partial [Methylocella sp.]
SHPRLPINTSFGELAPSRATSSRHTCKSKRWFLRGSIVPQVTLTLQGRYFHRAADFNRRIWPAVPSKSDGQNESYRAAKKAIYSGVRYRATADVSIQLAMEAVTAIA